MAWDFSTDPEFHPEVERCSLWLEQKMRDAGLETERIDDLEGVYASPIGAAGRVYLVGRNGATVVMKHLDKSDKIEVLATNQLDEQQFSLRPIVKTD